jgi:hypothetical protein
MMYRLPESNRIATTKLIIKCSVLGLISSAWIATGGWGGFESRAVTGRPGVIAVPSADLLNDLLRSKLIEVKKLSLYACKAEK